MDKLKKEVTICIVDKDKSSRDAFGELFKNDYKVILMDKLNNINDFQARNIGSILVFIISVYNLLDFEEIATGKYKELLNSAPIIAVIDEGNSNGESKMVNAGASEVVVRPFNPLVVKLRVNNVIDAFIARNSMKDTIAEQSLLIKKQFIVLRKQADKLKEDNSKIIEALSLVVEFRNLESKNHIYRIKMYTRILATCMSKLYPEYELTNDKIEVIVSAAALHDIGKITIPDSILLKPSKLTPDEYELMKSHTTKGIDVINYIGGFKGEKYYKAAFDICRFHHERYDGKGYPDNLTGEEIPISAQLVSIADVYDALVNDRVYKAAYPFDVAYLMVLRGECGVFSPKILECFRIVRDRLEKVAKENKA